MLADPASSRREVQQAKCGSSYFGKKADWPTWMLFSNRSILPYLSYLQETFGEYTYIVAPDWYLLTSQLQWRHGISPPVIRALQCMLTEVITRARKGGIIPLSRRRGFYPFAPLLTPKSAPRRCKQTRERPKLLHYTTTKEKRQGEEKKMISTLMRRGREMGRDSTS